jgi:hypothetical protein
LGGENVQAARGALRWVTSDAFEINFVADVTDQEAESPYDLLTAANPNTPLGINYNNNVALPTWGVPWDARFLPPNENVNYSGFNDLSTSTAASRRRTSTTFGTGARARRSTGTARTWA